MVSEIFVIVMRPCEPLAKFGRVCKRDGGVVFRPLNKFEVLKEFSLAEIGP